MVTWGSNTLHTFGGTPQASNTAPAGGSLFGASPSAPAPSTFGSAPAPSGNLFGSSSTPAPAPGSSFFGSSAPAPSGSIFGSAPSSGSLFGNSTTSSSTSFFSTSAPAPSMFGSSTTPANQQSQAQIPAQAALQAHMDASARQEAERVRAALERIHQAYAGSSLSENQKDPKFVAIVYDPLTPEQRQLQWLQGMGDTQTILAPNRPPQISEEQWKKAVVENPDPKEYTPQALIGATALQRRIAWQQERAKDLANHAVTMRKSQQTIKERASSTQQEVEEMLRRHAAQRKRLLDVMRRVEVARCMNQQQQPDEVKAYQRLVKLNNEVETVRGVLVALQDTVRTQATGPMQNAPTTTIPSAEKCYVVLKDQREKLGKLVGTVHRDQRDMVLLRQRLLGNDIMS